MKLEKVIQYFLEKPERMRMGKGKLSVRLNTTPETIVLARNVAKKQLKSKNKRRLPKILILDVETAPMRSYTWGRWKQNIGLPQTISESFMLTWSAKWLFDNNIMSARLSGHEALEEDDYELVLKLWDLLDQADIVIAHNGEKFDIPVINGRCVIHGMMPPSPYQQIDTLKIAKRQFRFSSNKLDALATYFGLPTKLPTEFQLWADCMKGSEEALGYMEKYNKYDVELLENVYLALRPWIKSHPNVALYMESKHELCGNCGSDKIEEVGYYYTSTGRYKTYRCNCGALSRVRTTDYPKEKRKRLLVSVAR